MRIDSVAGRACSVARHMRQVLGMHRCGSLYSVQVSTRRGWQCVTDKCVGAAASRHGVLMYARRQMADRLAGGPQTRS